MRAGNTHDASRGALSVFKRIVKRLREAWPEVEVVEIRADAGGFAVPAVYEWCEEEEGIGYTTIGLVSNNPRLEAFAAAPLLERALRESEERGGEKVQQQLLLADDACYQAGSWDHPRRVVYKAEVLEKGTNSRFVLTSRVEEPK